MTLSQNREPEAKEFNTGFSSTHMQLLREEHRIPIYFLWLAHRILISACLVYFLFWYSYIKQGFIISFVLPKRNFANCFLPSGRDSLKRRPGLNAASGVSVYIWELPVYSDSSYHCSFSLSAFSLLLFSSLVLPCLFLASDMASFDLLSSAEHSTEFGNRMAC